MEKKEENVMGDNVSADFGELSIDYAMESLEDELYLELELIKRKQDQIEHHLNEINSVIDCFNVMQETAARLEAGLVSKMDCNTWENVSEFIGLSTTTMLDECLKILDLNSNSSKTKVD